MNNNHHFQPEIIILPNYQHQIPGVNNMAEIYPISYIIKKIIINL